MDYKSMIDENFCGEPEIGEEAWEMEQEGWRILREEMEKDALFTEQDEELLRKNMKCTGYDYDIEVFRRGQSAHAEQDSATIEVPYWQLSTHAQYKLTELYENKMNTYIPMNAVVQIGMNDEWGSHLAVKEQGLEPVFLEHNQSDPTLCTLHSEACKENHEEALDFVARYRELNVEADKARVLSACKVKPRFNEEFYDDACAELQHDFADRYDGAILHEYAVYTEGREILFEHRGCVLSAKDGKLSYKDEADPKNNRIYKMFGETEDTPQMRKTLMDDAFNIAVKKENLYRAMGLVDEMVEEKGLAVNIEVDAENQFE